jgi:hypothetical protein
VKASERMLGRTLKERQFASIQHSIAEIGLYVVKAIDKGEENTLVYVMPEKNVIVKISVENKE